jgi:hypothetical protein
MKFSCLLLGIAVIIISFGSNAAAPRGGGGGRGGRSGSRSSGSKESSSSGGWFSGWFSSSKSSTPSNSKNMVASTAPRAPHAIRPSQIGWDTNVHKPIGPPPHYPGLDKMPVSANYAPPAYLAHQSPPAYSSINHVGPGATPGMHVHPPAYHKSQHYPHKIHSPVAPVPVINNNIHINHPTAHHSNFGSNALFFGMGAMSANSYSHIHHNHQNEARPSTESVVDVADNLETSTITSLSENLSSSESTSAVWKGNSTTLQDVPTENEIRHSPPKTEEPFYKIRRVCLKIFSYFIF